MKYIKTYEMININYKNRYDLNKGDYIIVTSEDLNLSEDLMVIISDIHDGGKTFFATLWNEDNMKMPPKKIYFYEVEYKLETDEEIEKYKEIQNLKNSIKKYNL